MSVKGREKTLLSNPEVKEMERTSQHLMSIYYVSVLLYIVSFTSQNSPMELVLYLLYR